MLQYQRDNGIKEINKSKIIDSFCAPDSKGTLQKKYCLFKIIDVSSETQCKAWWGAQTARPATLLTTGVSQSSLRTRTAEKCEREIWSSVKAFRNVSMLNWALSLPNQQEPKCLAAFPWTICLNTSFSSLYREACLGSTKIWPLYRNWYKAMGMFYIYDFLYSRKLI